MHDYDRSSKWLIKHYGKALLHLGGLQVIDCRALQAEVVQPRRLPDGLLEARTALDKPEELFLVEIATYPDRRIIDQVVRGAMLVYLERGQLPEVLTLILHPRGVYRVPGQEELSSPRRWVELRLTWRVVELWTIPAEQLLAANEVGLIPWVSLTRFAQPPEIVFQECRRRIDELAPAHQHENLLAVTQVLMGLNYNDPKLLAIFGGKSAMIESPVLQEFVEDVRREERIAAERNGILLVLGARFPSLPDDLAKELRTIDSEQRLQDMLRTAATCPSLDAFRHSLTAPR